MYSTFYFVPLHFNKVAFAFIHWFEGTLFGKHWSGPNHSFTLQMGRQRGREGTLHPSVHLIQEILLLNCALANKPCLLFHSNQWSYKIISRSYSSTKKEKTHNLFLGFKSESSGTSSLNALGLRVLIFLCGDLELPAASFSGTLWDGCGDDTDGKAQWNSWFPFLCLTPLPNHVNEKKKNKK